MSSASRPQQQQSRPVQRHVVVRAAADEEGASDAAATAAAAAGIKREEEKFAVINTGKWECKSCGYIYDQFKGDPAYPIAPGVSLEELREDWLCPEPGLRAGSHLPHLGFEGPSDLGPEQGATGFALNPAYGLVGNSLTSAQKGLLIWGSIPSLTPPSTSAPYSLRASSLPCFPPGVSLKELPEDWLCPTCGSPPSSFGSLSKELAGFAQNQAYGLGGNSLTSAQKGLLIWGSIGVAFLGFVSGYFLE
ncbi:unnamed protein product [Closterium sp. NIES-64]|nr:unnamed protein product [Closterium sp. NIES-64]